MVEAERRGKETRRKGTEKEGGKKKEEKAKKKNMMEIKKVAEEQNKQDKKEEETKSEKEARKLVLKRFYKWIHIFGKKASKKIPPRKLCNYVIGMKEGFVLRKKKIYLLLREEREEIYKFIVE